MTIMQIIIYSVFAIILGITFYLIFTWFKSKAGLSKMIKDNQRVTAEVRKKQIEKERKIIYIIAIALVTLEIVFVILNGGIN